MQGRSGALPVGSQLQGGKYVIEGTLGAGGFGITYRAKDVLLGRTVAIKELYVSDSHRNGSSVEPPYYYTKEMWEKSVVDFIREARTIASLDHPSIVTVHECFAENNTAYMVMKFIDGVSMMTLMQKHGGPLPEAEVLPYVAVVGEALAVLHANGVLHRDIKPSNIMLNKLGHPILIDFGAAREFVLNQSMTQSVIYTPGFAPPEQQMPKAKRGPFTDVYALAATCYFLLTGETPDIDSSTTLKSDKRISVPVRTALAHALMLNPADRTQNMESFLKELGGGARKPFVNNHPGPAISPNAPAPKVAPVGVHPRQAVKQVSQRNTTLWLTTADLIVEAVLLISSAALVRIYIDGNEFDGVWLLVVAGVYLGIRVILMDIRSRQAVNQANHKNTNIWGRLGDLISAAALLTLIAAIAALFSVSTLSDKLESGWLLAVASIPLSVRVILHDVKPRQTGNQADRRNANN